MSIESPQWESQTDLLVSLAENDLEEIGGVFPTMIAFKDDEPLFLCTLRAFEKRGHLEAVVEVVEFATLLGCNRLKLSLTGRAWSTRDPIPPVIGDHPEDDLRQQVIIVYSADKREVTSKIIPFDFHAGTRPVIRQDESVEEVGVGDIVTVLEVGTRGFSPAPIESVIRCLMQLDTQGHKVAASSALQRFLQLF